MIPSDRARSKLKKPPTATADIRGFFSASARPKLPRNTSTKTSPANVSHKVEMVTLDDSADGESGLLTAQNCQLSDGQKPEIRQVSPQLTKLPSFEEVLAEVGDSMNDSQLDVTDAFLDLTDAPLDATDVDIFAYEMIRQNCMSEPTGPTEPAGPDTEPAGPATEPSGPFTEPAGSSTEPLGPLPNPTSPIIFSSPTPESSSPQMHSTPLTSNRQNMLNSPQIYTIGDSPENVKIVPIVDICSPLIGRAVVNKGKRRSQENEEEKPKMSKTEYSNQSYSKPETDYSKPTTSKFNDSLLDRMDLPPTQAPYNVNWREKRVRQQMIGHDSPNSKKYYDDLGLSPKSRAARVQEVSRHRTVYEKVVTTPEHYWSNDLSDNSPDDYSARKKQMREGLARMGKGEENKVNKKLKFGTRL